MRKILEDIIESLENQTDKDIATSYINGMQYEINTLKIKLNKCEQAAELFKRALEVLDE